MADRRVSRWATWGASALACGALVIGGAGVGTAAAAPKVKTASVNILNYTYTPHSLKITVNTKVTWTNSDTTGHTVTFADFGKNALATGKTWSHKFTTAGTYTYYCKLHPQMVAKVVVSG